MQDTEEILARLTHIFRQELKQPDLTISPSTTTRDVPGWDSLTHMTLVHLVEREFQIKFRPSEILKFRSVGDMCQAVETRRRG